MCYFLVHFLGQKDKLIYALLSKPEVKKKRTRPISSHNDGTSLVNKGFSIWLYLQVKTTTTKHETVLLGQKFFTAGR